MPHSFTLISTIAMSLGLALIMGLVANRLKLPVLVGYLIAGILIGPATPGFVADLSLSGQLAEIGVILMMFGVGLHFSLPDLLRVKHIAIPGALVQMITASLLGFGLAWLWGWSIIASVIFGLCLSVASTVVLIRALEQRQLLRSINGNIAIGWLIVEDLAMVFALVLLPPIAATLHASNAVSWINIVESLSITLAKVGLFVFLMLFIGKRIFPALLSYVAGTQSRELFTLSVIAVAVGIAFGAAHLFGVSFALGAFFAGMIMRESPLSHRAAEESLPLRDAFSVLFFVSVGMLFDPFVLIERPWQVLMVVMIIVLGKSLASFGLVLLFRYPLNTALTVSASLAQIGEFSFILAGLAGSLGLLPKEAMSLILAGAIISISINHGIFQLIEPTQQWIRKRSRLARKLERSHDPLAELPMSVPSSEVTNHILIVGYGLLGKRIAESLWANHKTIVIAEENREQVERLRKEGKHAVAGDASDPAVLIQAHIVRAGTLIITLKNTITTRHILELAKQLNPEVKLFVRAEGEHDLQLFEKENIQEALLAEYVLADHISDKILLKKENL